MAVTLRRPGYALALSMLLTLALSTLAMGLLAVGTREQLLASATVRLAQAERNAEALALQVVREWSTLGTADMLRGERRIVPTRPDATIERIDGALFRIQATGVGPGPGEPVRATVGLLIRTIPLAGVRAAFPGALNAAGPVTVADAGVVSGATADPCGDGSPGAVAPVVRGTGRIEGTPTAARQEQPPALPDPDPFGPALAPGLASFTYTRRLAVPRASTHGGRCRASDDNWGSPDPGHPCYGLRPTVLAGDLIMTGGVGRGILIIHGNLRLTAAARFDGLVVVYGHLQLDGGSVINGAARARSAEVIDGLVSRAPCTIRAVLEGSALDGAFRDPHRWRLPAF